jgi:hypothetical protein
MIHHILTFLQKPAAQPDSAGLLLVAYIGLLIRSYDAAFSGLLGLSMNMTVKPRAATPPKERTVSPPPIASSNTPPKQAAMVIVRYPALVDNYHMIC